MDNVNIIYRNNLIAQSVVNVYVDYFDSILFYPIWFTHHVWDSPCLVAHGMVEE